MKNFFRASLLAVLFVGMSGFVTKNSSSEKTLMVNEVCEDTANFVYDMLSTFQGSVYSQSDLTAIWLDEYWNCIDNGGDSAYTANPK